LLIAPAPILRVTAAQAEMTFYGLAEFAVKVQDNIWDVIESSSRISIAGWVSSAVST